MSKKYQKNMLYILENIEKLVDTVLGKLKKEDKIIVEQVLLECKDAVSILEKHVIQFYCEDEQLCFGVRNIKEQFVVIENNMDNLSIVINVLDEIKTSITSILYKVDNMLENYCDVLFLPYKSSMWDSLESVWKAATEDKGCRAYVMPIPYYEKNEDGSLGDLHYEGKDFPSYVPVIDYREVDLEVLKPDMIFIHNPYDQYNRVTSVHPDYYTTELKKYTDLLVYIPYYISDECIPTSTEVMRAREGFCMTPGVLNSDVVILQSEKVKQLFVNILEKNMPNVSREHWEEKIWGLGSPKWDRVNAIQRDDQLLSPEWRNIIYKNDIERKKVIFYNTSLRDLLQQDNMLEKIKDTLKFFKENQDVALWWRPHPLYESTLESLRPHMLNEYRAIVKEYKEQQWGIFDDGVDLDWAIAETDAYYGDNSSVVQLFKTAKKPVMIQNAQIQYKEEYTDVPIWPSAFCIDGDDIWFVHGKINALMKYNIKEQKTCFITTIPNESAFQETLYSGIYKWKNRIYMIPCWAREIAVYDETRKCVEKISLKNIELYDQKMLFCKVFEETGYLYCVPYYYQCLLKIDMRDSAIEYIALDKSEDEYINDATKNNNSIIAIFDKNNKLILYNIETMESEIKYISTTKSNFRNITSVSNKIVCMDANQNCLQIMNDNNLMSEKEIFFNEKINGKITSFSSKNLLVDCVTEAVIKIINLDTEAVVLRICSERKNTKGWLYPSYLCSGSGILCKNEMKFYYDTAKCRLLIFKEDRGYNDVHFNLGIEDLEKIRKQISANIHMFCNENEMYKLNEWLRSFEKYTFIQKENSFIGEFIWKRTKKNV